MTKHFPADMQRALSSGTFKASFLLDPDTCSQNGCENCGGLGHIYIFGATEGPYQTPTAPYRSDGKVSKWHNGKWWVGNTVGFTCPDCHGLGYIKPLEFARLTAQVAEE